MELFIPKLIAYVALIWFVIQSLILFYRELNSEHAKQGIMPVLGFLYMCYSGYYILKFIGNFDDFVSFNNFKLSKDLHLDDAGYDYLLVMYFLTVSVLIAFTLNFCKSFFTLNSLEFGTVNDTKLKKIFKNSSNSTLRRDKFKPYIEAFLRLLIAFLFVLLEKVLTTSNEKLSATVDPNIEDYKYNPVLLWIGIYTFSLFTFIILWQATFYFWLDNPKLNNKKLPSNWYKLSFWQFFCGLIIGIFFFIFAWDFGGKYKFVINLFAMLGIAASLMIIVTIVISEFKRFKDWFHKHKRINSMKRFKILRNNNGVVASQ